MLVIANRLEMYNDGILNAYDCYEMKAHE